MASSGHSPPRYARLDNDPDGSPTCRDSPWSAGASALSPSPTSTTFLALAGAAAGTPLSSLDGEESASRLAADDGSDKMENEGLLAWTEPPRSQTGEASSAASAPSAPRSPAMAQSPERNRGRHAPQINTSQNTRLQNPLPPSDPTPSAPSVSAALPPLLVRPSFPSAPPPPEAPAIVRTTSSHGDLPLRHPVPDPNARSGALVGNVAHLEASAEQLAQFDSIEDAIREAHQELKRSDSRRSSLLAASVRRANSTRAASDTTDPASLLADGRTTPASASSHRPPRPQLLRAYSGHDSIIELNSAARSGGFSPHDYIMSPASSIAGSILQRSTSNGSASGSVHGSVSGANFLGISDQSITAGGDDYFPFLSRHGTGKSSMRSVRSGKLSLPEIAELEPPTTLTQAALDEADRVLAAGRPLGEDDHTLRVAGHPDAWPSSEQPVAASAYHDAPLPSPPDDFHLNDEPYPNPQEAAHDRDSHMGQGAPAYEVPEQSTNGDAIPQYDVSRQDRPTTSASVATFEQAQRAFRDFDGVHCDPDEAADQVPELPGYANPGAAYEAQPLSPPVKKARPQQPPPRPTSYMDPATGRPMLYYPAPVPAMLQLPTKLSNKGSKAAERRSQVMSMMIQARQEPAPKQERQSWLPDLTTGSDIGSLPYNRSGSLPDGLSSHSPSASQHDLSPGADGGFRAEDGPTSADVPGAGAVRDSMQQPASSTMKLRRPSRILDAEKRKTRMSTALDNLPPQLRASAYFDLPSATGPSIEAKNGSAMDTLDSILDASAHAPISAFTDHAFAGHLGAEVYGGAKKRNRKKAHSLTLEQLTGATAAAEKDDAPQLRASRSRSSFFGLVGNIRKVSSSVDGRNDSASDAGRVVSSHGRLQRNRSQNLGRDGSLTPGLSDGGGGLMAPDDDELSGEEGARDEDDEDDGDEEDEETLAVGAPTTLLAELHLRKQQQKMRTRPITSAFPNGMHSTLLELDAVAEVERKTRRVKKVNLAWEDPIAANEGGDGGMDDDEDVPLGLLYAAKTAGHNDVVAASADLSRPLGLMEKKELEDNEPLSRRRDRLQGRDPGAVSMYLSSGNAVKRQSVLALRPLPSPGQGSGQLTPRSDAGAGADPGSDASDAEDEPLAVRRNRVKARRGSELPLARPVSTSFSAELLSQFGDLDEGTNGKDAAKQGKGSRQPEEEEETLGQRRRRLQAEKEAREQEMKGGKGGGGLAVNDQALHALTGSSRLSRRLSMADLLSAAPAGSGKGGQSTSANRASRIPSSRTMTMSQTNLNRGAPGQWGATGLMGSASAAHLPSMGGGYMGMNMGTQNSMMGGAVPYGGVGMNGMGGMMGMHNNPYGNNTMAGGFAPGYNGGFGGFGGRGMPLQMPMGMGMPMQAMPMQMQMPMGMQRQMPMQMGQPPQVQIDRVERWRQGVYP